MDALAKAPPAADFTRRLSKYSALTVGGVAGSLACFESSEAALNISNIPDVMLTDAPGPPPQFTVDLNGDAVDDVMITVFSANIFTAQGLNSAELAGQVLGTFFYPIGFNSGSFIGGGASTFSGGTASPVHTFGTLANSMFAPGGDWKGGFTGYIGVAVPVGGGDVQYGWVHTQWDPSSDTGTIFSYAVENQLNTPAFVPEPTSLLLLGLGAMGLAARRRRDKA